MPFDNPPERREPTPVSAIILRAIDIIADPKRWTQGKVRRGFWWNRRRCAWGAALHALDLCDLNVRPGIVRFYLNEAARQRGFGNIVALNDSEITTHALVLEVMREAAELASVPG